MNGLSEKSPSNGIMTLPLYGAMRPVSGGTEPGTVASETNEKMPNCARRPLLISTSRPRASCASVFSGNHLNGS